MLKLLRIELLKIRRSLALLMLVAIPLVVVVFNVLVLTHRGNLAALRAEQVGGFWMSLVALWAFFMLPLFVALTTGLLNGQEHRNQSWRLMLTLPLSARRLYLAKLLLAWAFAAAGSGLLLLMGALALLGLSAFGLDVRSMWDTPLLTIWGQLALGCLPVVAIQHAIAWRVANLVAPLATAVLATMMITQVASSRYWVWLPWDYALMAVAGRKTGAPEFAMVLAACTGIAAITLGCFALARRVRA
ncbi:ABC transporter permease [Massilia sp. TS11]|uniref:ABC transporter permease n=1 Tax=Massilia sp. TS11 TaxID=2908003 RepID=UPI001EDA3DBF|nr:ABC transporter permease [Massilia sp. TS11]MCG2583293.1 ABC transporter permease [Massilia sp. TS11]